MPHLPKTARFPSCLGALFLSLAACSTPLPPVEHVTVAAVPDTLLSCQDAPPMPDSRNATQKDVAVLLAPLFGAWRDCHDNLGAVAGLIHSQEKALAK